jgi:hypothetical protein
LISGMGSRSRDRFFSAEASSVAGPLETARLGFTPFAPFKMRAARDAGDLPVSTVHVQKVGSTWSCTHRSRRLVTDVPRTVFNRLAPRGPRWCYFANHRFRRSTSTDGPDESPDRCHRRPWRRAIFAGNTQLGPPLKCCGTSAATVPLPHLKTPPETPLVGKDAVNIILQRKMSSVGTIFCHARDKPGHDD